MDSEPSVRDLSSLDPAVRQRAAAAVMARSRDRDPAGVLATHQQFIRIFEEEWRALESDREDAVLALARTMVDPKTGLLEVNLLAYALASAGEDGVTELLELLRNEDFSVHTYAAEGLGSLDNRARWAVPALCSALERSAADWTGFTIIRALGNIGGPRAIAVLQSVAATARHVDPPDKQLLRALEGALATALSQP